MSRKDELQEEIRGIDVQIERIKQNMRNKRMIPQILDQGLIFNLRSKQRELRRKIRAIEKREPQQSVAVL